MSNDPPSWLADRVAIAELKSSIGELTRRADAHDKSDTERFDRMFEFMELSEARSNKRFDSVEAKLDLLMADKNRRDGALGAGKVAAGLIGGIISSALILMGEFALGKFRGS